MQASAAPVLWNLFPLYRILTPPSGYKAPPGFIFRPHFKNLRRGNFIHFRGDQTFLHGLYKNLLLSTAVQYQFYTEFRLWASYCSPECAIFAQKWIISGEKLWSPPENFPGIDYSFTWRVSIRAAKPKPWGALSLGGGLLSLPIACHCTPGGRPWTAVTGNAQNGHWRGWGWGARDGCQPTASMPMARRRMRTSGSLPDQRRSPLGDSVAGRL